MGKFFSTAWVPVEVPSGKTIPIVVTDHGEILHEAFLFFHTPACRSRSAGWLEKAAQYLGLLYDFFRATQHDPLTPRSVDRFLEDFLTSLEAGTIQPDGTDPTGLHWTPASPWKVGHARSVIGNFCKFCDEVHGDQNVLSQGRFTQTLQSAYARESRKAHSKLFHLASRSSGGRSFRPVPTIAPRHTAKIFPRSLLQPLLFEGCRRPRRHATDFSHPIANEHNLPLMLALLILAGGGIRKSELFHIFADDISGDGAIRLYHPERGLYAWREETGKIRRGTRKEYLATAHQRAPRNLLAKHDPLFCGWKNMLLEHGQPHNYSDVYWIWPEFRELFTALHSLYIQHVRPVGCGHPYYFVSLGQSEFGQPWTVGAFNEAFRSALNRIGERADAERGINPHGLRHLYGQTLTDLGVRPEVIQYAMHHKSIESQMVYTKPTPEKINASLQAAFRFNQGRGAPIDVSALETYEWRSDPLKIFAPWNLGR